MKCAIVLADGVKQIMFTPENKNEKMALKMISTEEEITVETKEGVFYDNFRDCQHKGYNVALCQGGYVRAFEDSNSLMLVLKPKEKKKKKDEN